MKCFEVTINGQKVCTAGIGEYGVLNSVLSFVGGKESSDQAPSENLELTVFGVSTSTVGASEHIEWLRRALVAGDEIVIRIIEASECDQPASKETTYIDCSFCGKNQSEAKTLIAGPAVYICDECVRDSKTASTSSEPTGTITMILNKSAEATCSFCGRKPIEVDGIVGVPRAKICNHCIKICEEILAKDAGRLNPPASV